MDLREQLQQTLGSTYTLEHELSGGGMSRVFVAEEHTLGRKIVVKVLPPDTAAGVSVQRFKREIQLAARLQHPHIVPLLSAGDSEGLPYFTMPFVKGESLRARLARSGEMSVNEALHVLRDIASALAYAHGEGVVHRDIKPDNVILTGGVAVVTDFGVAKAMDLAATEAGGAKTGITSLGVALGTPAYMSPEQASADPQADHRSDIYSFGCLAYELLSGSSPFAGRSPQQMLAAHVTDVPDALAKRRPTVPPALNDLVMQCLEKRAGDRPQSAAELLAALDAIATPSGGTSPTAARIPAVQASRRGALVIVGAIAAIVVIVLAIAVRLGASLKTYQPGATTSVAASPAVEWHPAISPDGRFVAYTALTPQGSRVFVRPVGGGRAVMPAADLAEGQDYPQWSPDGTRLLFVASANIYVVSAFGGAARIAVPAPEASAAGLVVATWSPDGKSMAHTGNGLRVKAVDGADDRLVAEGAFLHSPSWSPDGRRLAYVDGSPLAVGNVSTSVISVVSSSGGTPTRFSDVVHTNESPVWAPDGKSLLFISSMNGALDVYQQAIDGSGAPTGSPQRLTTGLSPHTISISKDGTRLAYDVVRVQSNVAVVTAVPGRTVLVSSAQLLTNENQIGETVTLSNDGQWLVYDSNLRGNYDIYKMRTSGGEPVQLTTDSSNDFSGTLSPDGHEIAFHSTRRGTRDIFIMGADGGNEHAVTSGPLQDFQPEWSRDGNRIAYTSFDTMFTVHVIARMPGGQWSAPKTVTTGVRQLDWTQVHWSPDGSLLASTSAGNVWVVPSAGGARRVILSRQTLGDSAQSALWASDPNMLYVSAVRRDGVTAIWAVPLNGGPRRKLIEDAPGDAMYTPEFGTDGRKFYFMRAKVEGDVLVMELKR